MKLMGSPSGTQTFLRRMSSTLRMGSFASRFAKPPSMKPKRHEPGPLEPGGKLGIELGAHGVDLVERAEQQRDAVEVQRAVALAEPAGREGAALQLADADLAQDLGVVAHDAARIELDRYAAGRCAC